MAVMSNRRSAMVLFSKPSCIYSHRVRLVLAEKGIAFEKIDVIGHDLPEDLIELNPYQTVPTLVDRDLVLYESRLIMEYLDERFPHPPLMPVDPVSRAKSRLAIYRIESDWFCYIAELESGVEKRVAKARKELRDSLISITEIFSAMPYFLSEDYSLVDCALAPLMWRLKHYGIELPASSKPIYDYLERLFEREPFQVSLSEAERELVEAV